MASRSSSPSATVPVSECSTPTYSTCDVEADEDQGAQPLDPVTHEVVEEAAGDTEPPCPRFTELASYIAACTCPNCRPELYSEKQLTELARRHTPPQLTREDHDLARHSTDPLSCAWWNLATSSGTPNASWYPSTWHSSFNTDPAPMDRRRHLSPEREEESGVDCDEGRDTCDVTSTEVLDGALDGAAGPSRRLAPDSRRLGVWRGGCKRYIEGAGQYGGPPSMEDRPEEKEKFWWTMRVIQLPEEVRSDFGYPIADSVVTYAQLRNARAYGLGQTTMVETGFWRRGGEHNRMGTSECGSMVFWLGCLIEWSKPVSGSDALLNGHKRMRIYGVCRSAYVENNCMKLQDPRETEHTKLWRTFMQEHATELRSDIVAREHERMAHEHAGELDADILADRYHLGQHAVTVMDDFKVSSGELPVRWGFKAASSGSSERSDTGGKLAK